MPSSFVSQLERPESLHEGDNHSIRTASRVTHVDVLRHPEMFADRAPHAENGPENNIEGQPNLLSDKFMRLQVWSGVMETTTHVSDRVDNGGALGL